ncbi:MAG: hypothetical protein ABFR75_10020 [Acidobacteriota bacterium]
MYYNSTLENLEISERFKEKVNREFEPGESIIWIDKPRPKYFTASSLSTFLFAIPWTLFALFWTFGAAEFKIPDFKEFDFFPLFGLPFIIIGLVLLATPLTAFRRDKKTLYVITNKRAIIFIGGLSTTIHSFMPENLKKIYREEKNDGSGDVFFQIYSKNISSEAKRIDNTGFLRVGNAREVENMLKSLAGRASSEKKEW